MLRLLTLILAGMIGYYVIKGKLFPKVENDKPPPRREPGDDSGKAARAPVIDPGADGDMIEDPVCHTYVDKASAVSAVVGGREVYFCSETCRDRYLAGPGIRS